MRRELSARHNTAVREFEHNVIISIANFATGRKYLKDCDALQNTYLLEIEQQAVRGQGAATEEVVRHPATLIVAWYVLVRENVHK